ncbi:MAG: hypothetical protein HGA54_04100 [Actinobacteria bacterium]|nr:hypothetical protein [Actinomycetota bacterium]
MSMQDEKASTEQVQTEQGQNEQIQSEQIQNASAPLFNFRWRLAGGKLPLFSRHMRSLPTYGISAPLQAWIRSRVEWSLQNMTRDYPDGVLCIFVEDEDIVTITVEPSRQLPGIASQGLPSPAELEELGTIWLGGTDSLVAKGEVLSATNTLVRDLANTLGYKNGICVQCCETISESFVVSDEFGIIPLNTEPGPITAKMMECFNKVWVVSK